MPAQEGRSLSYGQAKDVARKAKTAHDKQARKIVDMQMSLEEEIAKLQATDKELVRAEKAEREALAKEVNDKSMQDKTKSITRAALDGTAEVDVSAILPSLDDPNLTEAGKQGLASLEASLKAAVATWALEARAHQQQMEVDAANGPKRKADDEANPEGTDPKVRLGQGDSPNGPVQVVLPTGSDPLAPTATDSAAAADSDEQRRLQAGAPASSSKEGGQPAVKAGAQPAQQTPGQVAAAARKAMQEKLLAELNAKTRSATVAAAAAAEAEAADKAMDAHIEKHS